MPYYQISYNGFLLPYVKTDVTEDPQYADDKFTNEGTNYNFNFSGFILGNTVQGLATLMEQARCNLSVVAAPFFVQWSEDGLTWTKLWDFEPESKGTPTPGDTSDQAFGPIPGPLRFVQITGGRAALYTWSVRCFRKNCYASNCDLGISKVNEVLSVTIRYSHSVDTNGVTTRTISGKLKLRSTLVINQAFGSKPADAYRNYIYPPIPTNFQRTQANYQQSEDGRDLLFSFTDEEKLFTFPVPVTGGQVSFGVRYEELGMIIRYSLTGTFSAPRSISKLALIAQVLLLVLNRIPLTIAGVIFDQREFTEDVYNNSISFNIGAYSVAGVIAGAAIPTNANGLLPGVTTFGIAPPGSTIPPWAIGAYGGDKNLDSGVIAYPPLQYDNCTFGPGQNQLPANSSTLPQASGQNKGSKTPTSTAFPSPNTGPSQQHISAPWIAFHEEISYEVDNGLRTFYPKTQGAKPIMQQVHNPSVTVVQVGYARRFAETVSSSSPTLPSPNPPILGSAGNNTGQVLQSSVQNATPDPVGDGTYNLYTSRWRYVMRLTDSSYANGIDGLNISYPADPRRTNSKPVKLPLLANISPNFAGVLLNQTNKTTTA